MKDATRDAHRRRAYVPLLDSSEFAKVRAGGLAVLDHHRALANNPEALRAFIDMSMYVRTRSGLPDRLRELAILAVGFATDSEYLTATHRDLALRAGITEQEVAAVGRGEASLPSLSAIERAVVAYGFASGSPFSLRGTDTAALRTQLSASELIEVLLTVGWYRLCASMFNALELPSADGT